jgi:hypothetical protein
MVWRTSKSLSGLTFFGLTPSYRGDLFTTLHEIVFYGQGGYDYPTVYEMPIWLRKLTYNKILKHYEQNSAEKDQDSIVEQNIETIKNANMISPPMSVKNASSRPTNTYISKSVKK